MTTVEEYYSLKPADYGPVSRLVFRQVQPEGATPEQILEVELFLRPNLSGRKMKLVFFGVNSLIFLQPEWSLVSLGLLDIRQVAGGFGVSEEEGLVKLTCKSFVAEVMGE